MTPVVKPPTTLSAPGKQMFSAIVEEFGIDDSVGLRLLQSACEAFEFVQMCQKQIKADGPMIEDGEKRKIHPMVAAMRDARSAMLQNLKALNCDLEPLKNIGRPSTHGIGV